MTPPPPSRRPSPGAAARSRDPERTAPTRAVSETEPKPRSRWRIVRRVVLGLFVLGIAGVAGLVFVLAQVPLPAAEVPVETTFIYDAQGRRLAELNAGENRVSKRLEEMSPNLIEAVLSAEDQDFFTHPGVDARAIVRATVADLRGRPLQGGSTITQQYVKVSFLNRERSMMRKLREATLAVKLERELAKEEILERYLNTIYFGRGAYGAQAASKAYFDVDVGDLDVAQAAYLAGLIRAPEAADANRADRPEQAAEADRRRNIVIRAMQEEGYIEEDVVQFIAAVPVSDYVIPRVDAATDRVVAKEHGTEYFVEYVKAQMIEQYGESRVNGGGLHIHTTLDLELQMYAYDAVYGALDGEGDPLGSLVSIDALGHVKAMVGGRGYDDSHVNLAVGGDGGGVSRSVGSTFKPFVLAELVRQGYSVDSMIDSPGRLRLPGVDHEFKNYGDAGHGRISIAEATRRSSNTAYVKMGQELGLDRVIATAHDLGVKAEIPEYPQAPLGGDGVPVIEMADAYLTFATRGEQVDPVVVTRVLEADGDQVGVFEPVRTRVLEENQADVVNDVLRGVVSGRDGTGNRAAIGRPVAGKTGTTSGNTDAWFVGYTPGLSTAVWLGHADPSIPTGLTGGSKPAEIFASYMSRAVTDERYGGDFVRPSGGDRRPFGGDEGRPEPATTTPPPTTAPPTTEAPTTTAPPTTAPPTTAPPTTMPPPPTSIVEDPPMTISPRPPDAPAPPTSEAAERPRQRPGAPPPEEPGGEAAG
jgi:penicillin-binding protein 1A